MNDTRQSSNPKREWLIGFLLICLILISISFYPVFLRLGRMWWISPDYSHGFLVTPFAGYLIYLKRCQWLPLLKAFEPGKFQIAVGVSLVLLAFCLRAVGILGRALPIEGLSVLVLAAGLIWLLMGPRGVWINSAAIVFLVFMLPIPSHLNRMVRGNLQSIATDLSIVSLQTMGVPAIERGNVISLPNSEVGVVEACSGIRILVSLAAIAFGIAILTETNWLRRTLLMVAVIPVALIANVSRIVMTAIGHEYFPTWSAEIHDIAGWVMIAIAVVLLILVKRFLAALLSTSDQEKVSVASDLAVR